MSQPRVITITLNPTIDRVLRAGEPGNGDVFAAGKGVNVSRALASLGVDSTAIVLLARADAEWFNEQVARFGPGRVELLGVPAAGRVRRHVTRLGATPAEGHHGPDPDDPAQLSAGADAPGLLEAAVTRACAADDIAAFCGSAPASLHAGALPRLIRAASGRGARVLIDMQPGAAGQLAGDAVWVHKSNAAEVAPHGVPVPACEARVVTHAQAGLEARLASGETLRARAELPPHQRVLDTVGCGDAATAGFIRAAIERPGDWAAMLRWAAACGSAAATRIGPGVLDPGFVRELLGAGEV